MNTLKRKFQFIGTILFIYVLTMLVVLFWAASHQSTTKLNKAVPKKTFGAAPNFSNINDVKLKKAAFFNYFAPIVEHENARILLDRKKVLTLKESFKQNKKLTASHEKTLRSLQKKYFIDTTLSTDKQINALTLTVNKVPPSLALAQAAKESGWGTSRFARKGFNFFGQWCYTKGCGIVPSKRSANQSHEVRIFKSPQMSVRAYINNINTHRAYASLRAIRQNLAEKNQEITGLKLADGLLRYSQRGAPYVQEIKNMIRHNKLEEYDQPN